MDDAINRHGVKSSLEVRKRRTKLLFNFTLLLTAIVLTMVYFLLPDILGKKETSSQIRQMTQLSAEVGRLETLLKKKEHEFSNLLITYHKQPGKKLPKLNPSGLTEGQKNTLGKIINNHNDPFIKELLRDIIDINDEIFEIKQTIKEFEALLPKPHKVIQGENHYQIAMSFLINKKGVAGRKASSLVERTALFEPMIPGFKVWNFYSGDDYGTFVTQGDAPISPNELSRKKRKELIDARDNAISEKESLATEIIILEKTRDNIKSEVKNLSNEKMKLTAQNDFLSGENEKMKREIETMKNSLSYLIDVEKNLKKAGILKEKFLGSPKLIEIPFEYFKQTIDLRETKTIEISAQQFELREIDEITLYPKFYKKDIDYKVEIINIENEQKAVITILTVEKFKTGRVIISVK